ncbi:MULTISPECIES: DUF350 domain-containing protein [Micromonospora]|uniref:DUF350 domain-containing protein n=2 Tax=Micromonospora TaxID=1873 RepID=A0A3N9YJ79_9ACTN|nr:MULTISPECIES: DUF350 domain-containing protein [Micromonospora]WTI08424.1 DUF350 domain-containing protein [Micromonospora sp. NBC_00821]MBM7491864.1 uncharacterized membrane protein YjfL (UPF0719 family) [Micromonospora luteifusca]MCG5450843.1 DUF350 domain-containing protein [Micromonospora hortensis]MCX5119542.1 DUF350 domain-containing protein [Micromonospora sp. NBC_00362]RQX19747.1 DUF350 domain-containing protein [Micromonospora ureilytica]
MQNLVTDLLATLAFGAVGVVLMGVGYGLVDLTTPGKLHELIWTERNRNAALLLASNLLGVGTIVVAAIVASDDDLALGLVGAAAYGIVGLVIMAAAFLLLDAVTPGRLGELLVDPEPHPAVWVSAVVHLATGAIIAAAIL